MLVQSEEYRVHKYGIKIEMAGGHDFDHLTFDDKAL